MGSSYSHDSEYCKEHKKKITLFCVSHNCQCCKICTKCKHRDCKNVMAIEKIIDNVKNSQKFCETENLITEILGTIQEMRKNRRNNLSSVQDQRKNIEKEILALKIKINKHLDKVQETLINELNEFEKNVQKQTTEILTSLIAQEKQLNNYQTSMSNIKKFASDLQTFISVHEIDSDVAVIDKSIQTLIETDAMKNTTLSCEINNTVQQFPTNVSTIGKIIVKSQPCEIKISRRNNKQAQVMVGANITLKLQKSINTQVKNTRGCVLLPDSRMLFSCFSEDRVISINKDGTQDFDTGELTPGTFDIAHIEDTNTIAVTSGISDPPCIRIIDMGSGQIKKTISVKSDCYGIVYRNNTLIYCAYNKGLRMINLNDESESDVLVGQMSSWSYVATYRDKLYYTNPDTHTVTCCDLCGKIQWQYKNERILKDSRGITVDNDGNVYVVGHYSKNVVVVSSDGQHGRQLNRKEDELDYPQVLHYDRSTHRLLVANRHGSAFLFQVARS